MPLEAADQIEIAAEGYRPTSPLGSVLDVRTRRGVAVRAVLATWSFTVFELENSARRGFCCIPLDCLSEFVGELDAGVLDDDLIEFLAEAPMGRVLSSVDQTEQPGLYDALGDPRRLLPRERDPITGRPSMGGGAGGSGDRPGKRRSHHRPRPRGKWLVAAGVAAAVVVGAVVVAVASGGSDDGGNAPAVQGGSVPASAPRTTTAPTVAAREPSGGTSEASANLTQDGVYAVTMTQSLSPARVHAGDAVTLTQVFTSTGPTWRQDVATKEWSQDCALSATPNTTNESSGAVYLVPKAMFNPASAIADIDATRPVAGSVAPLATVTADTGTYVPAGGCNSTVTQRATVKFSVPLTAAPGTYVVVPSLYQIRFFPGARRDSRGRPATTRASRSSMADGRDSMKTSARPFAIAVATVAITLVGALPALAAKAPKWETNVSSWTGAAVPQLNSVFGTLVGFKNGFVAIDANAGTTSVLTSPDGLQWTSVPSAASSFSGAAVIGLTAGKQGLLAWGLKNPGASQTVAFWTSKDAHTWKQVDGEASVFGAPGPGVGVTSVAEGPAGYVAVGFQGTSTIVNGLVWQSKDGATWTRVTTSPGIFGDATTTKVPLSVVYGDGKFVVVGLHEDANSDPRDTPLEWTSRDGKEWKAVEGPGALALPGGLPAGTTFGSGQFLLRSVRVLWAGRNYIVSIDLKNTNGTAYLEQSADGLTWKPLKLDGLVPASSLSTGGGAGSSVTGLSRVGPKGALIGGDSVDHSKTPSISPLVWTTSDGGGTWNLLSGGAFAPGDSATYEVFGVAGTAASPLVYGGRSTDSGSTLPSYIWVAGASKAKATAGSKPPSGSPEPTSGSSSGGATSSSASLVAPTAEMLAAAAPGSKWSVALELPNTTLATGACSQVTTPAHKYTNWKGDGASVSVLTHSIDFASSDEAAAAFQSLGTGDRGCTFGNSAATNKLTNIDKVADRSGGRVLHFEQDVSFNGGQPSPAAYYVILRGPTLVHVQIFGKSSDAEQFADKLVPAILKGS